MSLNITYEQLCQMCPSDNIETTIEWCRQQGLIARKLKCNKCMIYMFDVKTKRYKCSYGYECPKCRVKKAITTNSFFNYSNLPLPSQLRILHLFAQGRLIVEIEDELKISYRTLTPYLRKLRSVN